MPFQSEKQRRYMHANLPDIAKRWERDYSNGGITNLGGRMGYNKGSPLIIWGKPVGEQWDTLNEDQKKYIRENFPDQVPKEAAQGGLIPAHEAGIYGLAEGGQLVKSGPGRPGYNGEYDPGGWSAPSSTGGNGGGYDYEGEAYGTPDTIADLTEDYDEPDRAHEIQTQRDIKKGIKELKSRDQYDTRLTGEQKKQVNAELAAYYGDKPGTKYDLADWGADKAWGQKKSGIWGMLGKGILTFATAGAGAGLFGKDIAKAASLYNKYKQGKRIKTAWDEGKFKIAKKEFDISNLKNKLKSADQKLIAALPKGHPERIQKEGLKKETPDDVHERENGQIQETKPTITMDVEAVNDANAEKTRLLRKYQEMEWAAYRAQLEQQEMEAKKQAWLRQLRQTYMSAQGGRVPQGYNTGGLSNLFKLKNV